MIILRRNIINFLYQNIIKHIIIFWAKILYRVPFCISEIILSILTLFLGKCFSIDIFFYKFVFPIALFFT